jgi:carbonic anhydrase
MSRVTDILEHNTQFVDKGEYHEFTSDRFPSMRMVILTCMDARLIELLPKAMGVGNGDAKVIKNAGAIVSHPFGSIMRSILVAVYELGAEEVVVVGHHDCGMTGLSCARIIDKAKTLGVSDDTINTLRHSGIDLQRWLTGFESVETGVTQSVAIVRNHPLLPKSVTVHGLIMDPHTGKLELVVDGYAACDAK